MTFPITSMAVSMIVWMSGHTVSMTDITTSIADDIVASIWGQYWSMMEPIVVTAVSMSA